MPEPAWACRRIGSGSVAACWQKAATACGSRLALKVRLASGRVAPRPRELGATTPLAVTSERVSLASPPPALPVPECRRARSPEEAAAPASRPRRCCPRSRRRSPTAPPAEPVCVSRAIERAARPLSTSRQTGRVRVCCNWSSKRSSAAVSQPRVTSALPSGSGRSLSVTWLMMPSVPSAPMCSLHRS